MRWTALLIALLITLLAPVVLGPNCEAQEVIDGTVSAEVATAFDFSSSTTCSCSCDYEIRYLKEFTGTNDQTVSDYWDRAQNVTSGSSYSTRFYVPTPEKREALDGDTGGLSAGVAVGCEGINVGPPCSCQGIGGGETGTTWEQFEVRPLDAMRRDEWDQDGDGDGDGSGQYVTHEGRPWIVDDFGGAYRGSDTSSTGVDPWQNVWGASTCVGGGCPFTESPGVLNFDGDETNVALPSAASLPENQWVHSYLSCDGCGSANQDHTMQLRRADANNMYQCKIEFCQSGSTPCSVKWNIINAGTPGGACASFNADLTGLPFWVRCEAYTDDYDSDGKEEAHLLIFVASDSSGNPGTWDFQVELVHEETDGLYAYYGDGTSGTPSCTGGWAGSPLLAGGQVGLGLAKSADHEFDRVMAGELVGVPQKRHRRSP